MSKCKSCLCDCHCNVGEHSDANGVCHCEKCNCNPQGITVNDDEWSIVSVEKNRMLQYAYQRKRKIRYMLSNKKHSSVSRRKSDANLQTSGTTEGTK